MRKTAGVLFVLMLAPYALAPHALAEQPAAGDAVAAPAGLKMLLQADAAGVQVYVCKRTDKGFDWVFGGPSAALFDERGRQIGEHEAGPIWTLEDGSGVTGTVEKKADAPAAGDIPWLLLKVKEHVGSFGQLSAATYVRRVATKGGVAPVDGCGASNEGATARIRYTAAYQFYGP